jgi:arylformamidase
MQIEFQHSKKKYMADFSAPINIDIPLGAEASQVSAWHCSPPRIEPVVMGDWVGEVSRGAPVNFRNIFFNPHGNGTHTECVGHISKEWISVNRNLKKYHFMALLISVEPSIIGEDRVIMPEQLEALIACKEQPEALIIRTLPQTQNKIHIQYTGSNPPYMHHACAEVLHASGIQHLLIDLPSVDREEDEGKLLMHHAFWSDSDKLNNPRTITELVFVDENTKDGLYLLNMMIAPFENDATPSKPVLYRLLEKAH